MSTIARRIPDWHGDASCGTDDFDVFFGPWRESPSARAEREAKAKAICGGCQARIPCLEWALRNRIEYGVFGGLSEQERRPLHPARSRVCQNDLHEMTAENTYTYPNGVKACRACKEACEARRPLRRHDRRQRRTEEAA